MQLFVPPWVSHRTGKSRKTPIYSLHVHPSGLKLATAGLENIKIWSMQPISSQKAELDAAVPKQLSSMSIHDGAILCVRWSPRGEYLASGSEDAKVVIWKLDGSKIRNTGFGESNTTKHSESYRVVKILPAHESDVADLAWSHDQAFLASCGFDRRVVIWGGVNFEQIRRIDCHEGFVKGVTWDPAGKYLATQSDDRSIKIFRTSDWEVETTITEPLESGASTSFFTRLSWSPDGATIAATNGESGSVCVAPLIQRQDWKSEDFFVGHKAAVEVASFNPRLFGTVDSVQVDSESVATVSPISICATGSQDNGISIWSTAHPRALANVLEVVDHSVLDLCWTPDGYGLLGCSYDGTVVYLGFSPEELGRALSTNEMDNVLGRYGKRRAKHAIPESTFQLELELQMDATVQAVPTPAGRIADLMAGGHQGFANQTLVPTIPTVVAATVTSDVRSSALSQSSASQSPKPNVAVVQTISQTKDGKKRIQPIFIQSSDDTSPNVFNLPNMQYSSPVQLGVQPTGTQAIHVPVTRNINDKISDASANIVSTATAATSTLIPPGGIPIVTASSTLISNRQDPQTTLSSTAETTTKYVLPMVYGFEALPQLGIPVPRNLFISECVEAISNERIAIECRNDKKVARLVCTRGSDQLWQLVLQSPVLLSCITSQYAAVTCVNATLSIFSLAGRRLFSNVVLASCSAYLAGTGSYLLCIDGTGQLNVWNVVTRTQIMSSVSIAPLIHDEMDGETDVDVTITNVKFKRDGIPIITTSRGIAFTFDVGMRAWMRLVDVGMDTYAGVVYTGREESAQVRRFPSLDMLEERLVSAISADAPAEYRHWLRLYSHKLVDENALSKAKELCDDLTGTGLLSSHIGTSSWEPLVLGLPKAELFKELAPILAQNRSFQRILDAARPGNGMVNSHMKIPPTDQDTLMTNT
ncbi:hypothetical protein BASA83_007055 [Batrachochytrium salamandrivorans]|nr:hypothetical protein BASA83_007055 [Batrachochytrium salamandrivorans]